MRWLLEQGAVVIAAGGGGIPTMYVPGTRTLVGVEAVVDKDLASAVLAEQIGADLFVVATEVDAVYVDWGTPRQRAIRQATPDALAELSFPAGSMGPKVGRRQRLRAPRPGSGRSSAPWTRSPSSWPARWEPRSSRTSPAASGPTDGKPVRRWCRWSVRLAAMGHVDVNGVRCVLPDGRTLFGNVSFRVGDGAVVALVGANGAGKTTLMRIIAGDVDPLEGSVSRSGGLGVMRQFVGSVRDDSTVRDLLVSVAPPRIRRGGARAWPPPSCR